jgi:hypothetical protein
MTSSLRKQNVALPRDLLKDFTLERLQELIDKDEEFDAFVLPLSEDLDEVRQFLTHHPPFTFNPPAPFMQQFIFL